MSRRSKSQLFALIALGTLSVLALWALASRIHLETFSNATFRSHYIGKTFVEVIERLGPADDWTTFTIGDVAGEFRIELLNFYPKTPANANVAIKELRWKLTGRNLILWFHEIGGEWIVLDGFIWKEGTAF